ncbi:malonyl CoA-ACP transacylase [Pelistega indica]|uniref:Malonyl CoA-acyl carrier protein transacylase n=1 Tax=Pelistega indica TaxID=1414851 RepID=V8G8Z2_9BURK|nr:ACP S-malonyltransferase [Pelistega indica]ETD72895.1 malonyl CoA-ACP transacylase [Pelistega indica]
MKLAMVFPGQGSQAVGMLDAWKEVAVVQNIMQRASNALDQDLVNLIANGPAEQLNLTTNTQPVMLAASYAMYQAYIEQGGVIPSVVAGHSLGEYTALAAAGVISLEDAVKLVRIRANAMQDAVPVGAGSMAAILGLDDETVQKVCNEAAQGEVVEAVNFNAPAQVVIAGHKAAVERACELAKKEGAKRALVLPVSAPFHSSLLKPAATILEKALNQLDLVSASIDIINNVDVETVTDSILIKDGLVRQAWHPVRWVETIQRMQKEGVTHIVECGPGKVLTGLVKRIAPEIQALSITDPTSLASTLDALKN